MSDKKTSYYHQSRPEMLAIVPDGSKAILDVGCGGGDFGVGLQQKCPQAVVSGIEINQEVADRAPSIYTKVHVGDVHQVLAELPNASFDLIVFNDLLEHLVDPYKCLASCQRLLQPGGRILASIPNMRFWPALSDLVFQADWRYRDAGVMDETHLRFFTEKSIRRMFDDAGFVVEQMHGINKTWIFSWRWRILNLLFRGQLNDCLYPQFAVVAVLK
ncbi:MAG: class I SAM-dependent methyltransferase [Planctomycetales bacterium]|nr:class I SAM-dependent methyltransferase [Planctomycetales bacterium]